MSRHRAGKMTVADAVHPQMARYSSRTGQDRVLQLIVECRPRLPYISSPQRLGTFLIYLRFTHLENVGEDGKVSDGASKALSLCLRSEPGRETLKLDEALFEVFIRRSTLKCSPKLSQGWLARIRTHCCEGQEGRAATARDLASSSQWGTACSSGHLGDMKWEQAK